MAARTKSATANRLPEVLKALAEPRRVAIVRLVHERELPAGEIAVVIADVSGKGVAAGLLMPSIEVALRMDAARFSEHQRSLANVQ